MAMSGGESLLLKSGTPAGWPGPINIYLYWKLNSQDIVSATSSITCGMYLTTPPFWYIGPWTDVLGSWLSIGGDRRTFGGSIPGNTQGTYWFIEDQTFTVQHQSDGTGIASVDWQWGGAAPFANMGSPARGTASLELPFIPRASSITLPGSGRMGSPSTITINRYSTSFTHTLTWAFGGTSGTIVDGYSGGTIDWTPPTYLAAYCNNTTGGTCTVTVTTWTGGTRVGTAEASYTVYVPGAATVSSPGTAQIGAAVDIPVSIAAANFRVDLVYRFGRKTGTIASRFNSTSARWNVPADLAEEIPGAATGTATITATTYNGTAYVGSTEVSVTLQLPQNDATRPTIQSFDLEPVGTESFPGLYIKGQTGVRATFSAAAYYSSIVSYSVSGGGTSASGNPATTGKLGESGAVTITGTVTDRRGFSRSTTRTITVIPYDSPRVSPAPGRNTIICERSSKAGVYDPSGDNLHVIAARTYSPVMADGAQKNFCRLMYRIDGGAWETLLGEQDAGNDVDKVIPGVLSPLATFRVEIAVSDTISGMGNSVLFRIPTDKVTFDLRPGGNGAAFGKYAEMEKVLELAEGWVILQDGMRLTPQPHIVGGNGSASYIFDRWGEIPIGAFVAINEDSGGSYHGVIGFKSGTGTAGAYLYLTSWSNAITYVRIVDSKIVDQRDI